jgi:hypothetical protein
MNSIDALSFQSSRNLIQSYAFLDINVLAIAKPDVIKTFIL